MDTIESVCVETLREFRSKTNRLEVLVPLEGGRIITRGECRSFYQKQCIQEFVRKLCKKKGLNLLVQNEMDVALQVRELA